MRNHNDKVRDITRSVLPSTHRCGARIDRKHIHRAERRAIARALRAGDDNPRRDRRGDIADMVGDRRSADKVAPLVRWALHHVRVNPRLAALPLHEQVDHFRQLLPDNTIGRHALSHIAWPLEYRRPDYTPAWLHRYRPAAPDVPLGPVVRRLYENGYHAELNHRLKTELLPVLHSISDLDAFADSAGEPTRQVVLALAAAVHLA